jgi:DNA-binding transcriptional ArsR family regulator
MGGAVTPADNPFAALGDGQRRAILRLLGQSDRSVKQLADELPISRPAVSRHLRVLKEAGLVGEEPQGTRRIYHLRTEGVLAVQRYLDQVWGEAGSRFRLLAENTRPDDPSADVDPAARD